MRKLILFILFLLIAQLSFSQNKYPKKQIQEGDTVIVITLEQLSLTNSIIEERNQGRKFLTLQDSLLLKQKSFLQLQEKEIERWKQIDKLNKELISSNKRDFEKMKKDKTKAIFFVGGISFVVGGFIGVLICTTK